MINIRPLTALWIIVAVGSVAWAAPVSVYFQPAAITIADGQSVKVDILADLPDPVVGWGLDLSFPSGLLRLDEVITGPAWIAAPGSESDDIAALILLR